MHNIITKPHYIINSTNHIQKCMHLIKSRGIIRQLWHSIAKGLFPGDSRMRLKQPFKFYCSAKVIKKAKVIIKRAKVVI